MNVTNERLEEYAENGTYYRSLSDDDLQLMARELLSLRTGEVDEEVEGEFRVALQGRFSTDEQKEAVIKLHSFAIARGHQLRAAQAEVEKWKNMPMQDYTAEYQLAIHKLDCAKTFIDALSVYLECEVTEENSGNWSSYLQTVANNFNLRMNEACNLRDKLQAEINNLKEQIASSDESLRLERSVTDQQHQEQISTLTAERDSLKEKAASMERRVDQLENTLTQMNIGLPHWED